MIDEALIKVAKELDELKEERVEYIVSNVAYKYEIECLKKENEALKTCIMTDHHKIHELTDVIDEVKAFAKKELDFNKGNIEMFKYALDENNPIELSQETRGHLATGMSTSIGIAFTMGELLHILDKVEEGNVCGNLEED